MVIQVWWISCPGAFFCKSAHTRSLSASHSILYLTTKRKIIQECLPFHNLLLCLLIPRNLFSSSNHKLCNSPANISQINHICTSRTRTTTLLSFLSTNAQKKCKKIPLKRYHGYHTILRAKKWNHTKRFLPQK